VTIAVHAAEEIHDDEVMVGRGDDAWYDSDISDGTDSLSRAIGIITTAAPGPGEVIRGVYHAAGEQLPNTEAFEESELGESEDASQRDTNQALTSLLAAASHPVSAETSDKFWTAALPTSKSTNQVTVQMKPNAKVQLGLRSDSHPVQSDDLMWKQAVLNAKRKSSLDLSHDFVPTNFLQLHSELRNHDKKSNSHAPSSAAVERSIMKLNVRKHRLETEVKRDMEIAEITSNTEDLRKGTQAAHRLEATTRRLHTAKRRAAELKDLRAGRENAHDFLTAKSNIEQRINRRVRNEHIQRLRERAKDMKRAAYRAQIRAAYVLKQTSGGQSSPGVQLADAKAQLAKQRNQGAAEALDAALEESKGPFTPSARPDIETLMKSIGSPLKKGLQRLATMNAKKAQSLLKRSLLTDRGFSKAAAAAKIALAYEHTAMKAKAETVKEKLGQSKAALKKAVNRASKAMQSAILTGTHRAYAALRQTLSARRDAQDKVEYLELKIKANKEHQQMIKGSPAKPDEQSTDAAARYYEVSKQAERAYDKAIDSGRQRDVGNAASLVQKGKKLDAASRKSSFAVARARTIRSAQKAEHAKGKAIAAIYARHGAVAAVKKSKRSAWNAISAKELAISASERVEDRLQTTHEMLNDASDTVLRIQAKYRKLQRKTRAARLAFQSASAKAEVVKKAQNKQNAEVKKTQKLALATSTKDQVRLKEKLQSLKARGNTKRVAGVVSRLKQAKKIKDSLLTTFQMRKVQKIQKEASATLAQKMNNLVKGEEKNVENQYGKRKSQLKAVVSDAVDAVKTKLKKLGNSPQKRKQMDSELHQMFAKTAKLHSIANDHAKERRNGDLVKRNAHAAVKRLQRLQMQQKPLKQSEKELQKIVASQNHAKAKLRKHIKPNLQDQTKAITKKIKTAKAAMRLAKNSMKTASQGSTDVTKKAFTAVKTAQKVLQRLQVQKKKIDRKMAAKKMETMNTKQMQQKLGYKQATKALSNAKSENAVADKKQNKEEILQQRLKTETTKSRMLTRSSHQDIRIQQHRQRKYERLKHKATIKKKLLLQTKRRQSKLRKRLAGLKIQFHHSKRRIKIQKKIAHLADQDYEEARRNLKSFVSNVAKKKKAYRVAKQELKVSEDAEKVAYVAIQKQGAS